VSEVTHGAELVIVALPHKAIATFNSDLLSALPRSVPVVDTSNYVPGLRDPHTDELDNGAIEADGSRHTSATPSPRHSTRSLRNTCSRWAAPPATPTGSPFRSPATTAPPRPRCSP